MQVDNTLNGIREVVATAVRVEMARKNMTQQRLAELTGLKQAYISRRMTGETPFDIEDLALLAQALDVQVSQLLPSADGPARAA